MYSKYLITGAAGFLGRAILEELAHYPAEVTALVLPDDPQRHTLPDYVHVVTGDIADAASLKDFFRGAGPDTCVLHCAGLISIASRPGKRIYRVNVGGTRNILEQCRQHHVGKLVYVSSVHAITEAPKGAVIQETTAFSPHTVDGAYAKSKAMATSLVLDAARQGLNASVVQPSGIIGPGDSGQSNISGMLLSYLHGKLPFAVRGGYDFVDVRDVASGILACADKGRSGSCYILSGHYTTIRSLLCTVRQLTNGKPILAYLPLGLARAAAPLFEKISLRRREPLYFTPYSVAVLGSNGHFSHHRASEELAYQPRSLADTLRDTLAWLGQAVS